jgi:hypothetical protein
VFFDQVSWKVSLTIKHKTLADRHRNEFKHEVFSAILALKRILSEYLPVYSIFFLLLMQL